MAQVSSSQAPHTTGLSFVQRLIPVRTRLLIAALVTGVCAGACARSLKWMIGGVTDWIMNVAHGWLSVVTPFLALTVTALICRYVFRERLEHGVEQIKHKLATGNLNFGLSRIFYPMAASTLTLGLGGSGGAEGPMAYTGAAIASNVARAGGIPEVNMPMMIACGAGAGIAAIFKSPLGGAMFTFEVMHLGFSAYATVLIFASSITAGLVAYMLDSCKPDIVLTSIGVFNLSMVPALLVMGMVAGLYSIYYNRVIRYTRRLLGAIRSRWAQVIVAGVLLSAIIALIPAVYGEGYGVASALGSDENGSLVRFALSDDMGGAPLVALVALLVLLLKSIATSLTNNGGGVSGDFAPTIFSGAVVGYLFAFVVNTWLGGHLPVGQAVLYGMGAVMAGAIGAPIMAIVIVTEMTGQLDNFLPMTITAAASYLTVRMILGGQAWATDEKVIGTKNK